VTTPSTAPETEDRLAGFVDAYAPEIAACLRASRANLRSFLPHGFELVYDNYNALVLAYGPSERASELLVSLAAYPRWVTLFFAHGASLADPAALLSGDGARIRGIRLASAEQVLCEPVKALLSQALSPARAALASAPALCTVVKSVSSRKLPRRPPG
jgi:hypothetical protein